MRLRHVRCCTACCLCALCRRRGVRPRLHRMRVPCRKHYANGTQCCEWDCSHSTSNIMYVLFEWVGLIEFCWAALLFSSLLPPLPLAGQQMPSLGRFWTPFFRFLLCAKVTLLSLCSYTPDQQILKQGGASVRGDLYRQRAAIYVNSSAVRYGTR